MQPAEVAIEDLVAVLLAALQRDARERHRQGIERRHVVSGHRLFLEGGHALARLFRVIQFRIEGPLELGGIRRGVARGGDVGRNAGRHERGGKPEAQQQHQRHARRRRPGRHGQADAGDDKEVEQAGGPERQGARGVGGQIAAGRGPAKRQGHQGGDGHNHQAHAGQRAEGLAGYEHSGGHPETQQLAQRALLALGGKHGKGDQQDEEGHQHQQHFGAVEVTEPLNRRAVLGRAELHLALAVRLEPDGHAQIRIEARVDNRQVRGRLECIHAVVRGRVRVLFLLVEPLFARLALRLGVLPADSRELQPSGGRRGHGQQQDDGSQQAEAAVTRQLGQFLAGNGPDHRRGLLGNVPGRPISRACARDTAARDRRAKTRRCHAGPPTDRAS